MKYRITQVKSGAGYSKRQNESLKALSLGKMHKTVVLNANPIVEGLIKKVSFLVKVEQVAE